MINFIISVNKVLLLLLLFHFIINILKLIRRVQRAGSRAEGARATLHSKLGGYIMAPPFYRLGPSSAEEGGVEEEAEAMGFSPRRIGRRRSSWPLNRSKMLQRTPHSDEAKYRARLWRRSLRSVRVGSKVFVYESPTDHSLSPCGRRHVVSSPIQLDFFFFCLFREVRCAT